MIDNSENSDNTSIIFLRKVIDTDPNLIFAKDWNGVFTLANKALADIYGTTPEELVGKTDSDFNKNEKEVAGFLEDDRKVMETHESRFIREEKVTDAMSGKVYWFQTIKVPLLIEGKLPQILGIATDITERKEAEDKLERRTVELEKLNRFMVDRELKMVELKKKLGENRKDSE
jgi:PAS domain S-box-containing protein